MNLTLRAPISDLKTAAVKIIESAMQVEQTHTVRAIEALIDRTEEGLEAHIAERTDAMDAYFDGLRDSEEPVRPQKTAEELAALIRPALRFDGRTIAPAGRRPGRVQEVALKSILNPSWWHFNVNPRWSAPIEHRLGEPLGVKIAAENWNEAAAKISSQSRELMEHQRERLTSTGRARP